MSASKSKAKRTNILDVNELKNAPITSEQSESRCLLNVLLATWRQRL